MMAIDKADGAGGRSAGRSRGASSRVYYAPDAPPSALAVWASRISVFSTVALIVTIVLHRLLSLPTPVALTIAAAVFFAAAAALLMAAIAGLDIWVTGRQGAARVIIASFLSLVLLALPASAFVLSLNYPAINDVTTDLADPPEFSRAKVVRDSAAGTGINPAAYPGGDFVTEQQSNYPDLKGLVVPRSPEQAFELVLQALAKLRHKTAYESPPDLESGEAGVIEFTEHTLVLGFADDVVIRVRADGEGARIDVRSASRYGRNDFGANAERVRLLLKEIVGRLEASLPEPARRAKPAAADDDKSDRDTKKRKTKRRKARDPT